MEKRGKYAFEKLKNSKKSVFGLKNVEKRGKNKRNQMDTLSKLKPNEKSLKPLVNGREDLGCPEIEYVQIEADSKEVALRLKRAYAVLFDAVMEKRKLDSMRQELA